MQSHKEIAVIFEQLVVSGQIREAYEKYVSPDFRHHNPYFKGDAVSLKAGMAEAHEKFPATILEVQHLLEDGEFVAVHSRVQHGPETSAIAVVHIFRFAGEQIAELWDVGMEVPADSPNEYGMF